MPGSNQRHKRQGRHRGLSPRLGLSGGFRLRKTTHKCNVDAGQQERQQGWFHKEAESFFQPGLVTFAEPAKAGDAQSELCTDYSSYVPGSTCPSLRGPVLEFGGKKES